METPDRMEFGTVAGKIKRVRIVILVLSYANVINM